MKLGTFTRASGWATLAASLVLGLAATPAVADGGNGGANGGGWSVSYFTPNAVSLGATIALHSTPTIQVPFLAPDRYLALIQGGQSMGLTGNLTGETLSATYTIAGVSNDASFVGNSDQCTPGGNPPSMRLYFATGHSVSRYNLWWADSSAVDFTGNASGMMTVSLDPSNWSDLYGDSGSNAPTQFAAAVANVTVVGISFGDGCHYENGVTTSDGSGTFTSQMSVS